MKTKSKKNCYKCSCAKYSRSKIKATPGTWFRCLCCTRNPAKKRHDLYIDY